MSDASESPRPPEAFRGTIFRDEAEPTVTTDFAEENIFEVLDQDASRSDESAETRCQLHTYDARYNSKGEKVYLSSGWKRDFALTKDDHAALVLIRIFTHEKILRETILEIRSPHVKQALRSVVKSYPGVNLDASTYVTLRDEPQCMFHYRNELQAYAKASNNPVAKEHILFCLRYASKTLERECKSFKNTMVGTGLERGIEFDYLWMVFKPGDIMYARDDRTDRAYRLVSITRNWDVDDSRYIPHFRRLADNFASWSLLLESIASDGENLGHVRTRKQIPRYDGYQPLRQLAIYPFRFLPEREKIRNELVPRGGLYTSLLDVHYRHYRGAIDSLNQSEQHKDFCNVNNESEEGGIPGSAPKVTKERVVIDCAEALLSDGHHSPVVLSKESKIWKVSLGEHRKLQSVDLLICTHLVPGFSLGTKTWGVFDVSRLKTIQFDATAFEMLVLSSEKKRFMLSVIEMRAHTSPDLIRGKGRGLIFLLHGPPGVGKTFTAESIAEHTKRPLWTINCSDLGHKPEICEKRLTESLRLAKRWNAIVLIDEADVFMAARTLESLERNELVAVLLRILESFDGVMFLTTNQVQVIDPAFKSRIHLSIAYPDLCSASRRQLWEAFITNAATRQQPKWLSQELLDTLAKSSMNGREIKNAVRVAQGLASHSRRELLAEDIERVLRVVKSFDEEACAVAQAGSKRSSVDCDIDGPAKRRKT